MVYECTIQDGTHFCQGEGRDGRREEPSEGLSTSVTILLRPSGWTVRMGFMGFFYILHIPNVYSIT